MSVRAKRLSAAEAEESRLLLGQLCSEGIDPGEDAEIPRSAEELCPIEITRGMDVCVVHDRPPVYAVSLCIVARRQVNLADVYILNPWGECLGLADLKKENGRSHLGPLSFWTRDVLNDRFINPVRLFGGQVLEGMILAQGMIPIPPEMTKSGVPIQVTVEDSLRRTAQAEIRLMVDGKARQREVEIARAQSREAARELPMEYGRPRTTDSPDAVPGSRNGEETARAAGTRRRSSIYDGLDGDSRVGTDLSDRGSSNGSRRPI